MEELKEQLKAYEETMEFIREDQTESKLTQQLKMIEAHIETEQQMRV